MKEGKPKFRFKPGKMYVCVEANYAAMAYMEGRDPAYVTYTFNLNQTYRVDSLGRIETGEGVVEATDSLYNAFIPYESSEEKANRKGLCEKVAIAAMQGIFSNEFLMEKMWNAYLQENHYVEMYNISDIVTSQAIAAAEMMADKLIHND